MYENSRNQVYDPEFLEDVKSLEEKSSITSSIDPNNSNQRSLNYHITIE